MRCLCFDIGGTSIKYTVIENDKIGKINKIPTRKTKTENYILKDIIKICENYKEIDSIGVCTAGVIDSNLGEIIFSGPTIPGYTGTKIKKSIEEKFNIPCFVENDVNCAAYGEYIFTNSCDKMFCMTVGTGVGGAFILNGSIYKGSSLKACEIGYMPFKKGTFQDYASTSFLTEYVSKKIEKKVDGIYIFENAKKGDKICKNAINIFVNNLTLGILNIIYTLNPCKIVIGGGITAQKQYLEPLIIKNVNKKLINKHFSTDIELASLENKAGLFGIYCIIRKELKWNII